MKSLAEIQLKEWLKNARQNPILKEDMDFEIVKITSKEAEFLEKAIIAEEGK